VGPLLLEIPLVNVGLSTKNRKMLTDKLNICDYSKKQTTDLACGVSGLAAWTESCLLNKVILVPIGQYAPHFVHSFLRHPNLILVF
jgi:hypothetical protein